MTDKPTLDGQPLGGGDFTTLSFSDETLRKMDHAQWLGQFAEVLGINRPGSPPTSVFRQGAITRLKLAKRYIEMLEKELADEREGNAEGR